MIAATHSLRSPTAATVRATTLPLVVAIFVFLIAAPPETCFNVGPLRLSAYRVVALLFLIPLAYKLFSRRCGKVVLPDLLMIFHGVWAALALVVSEGPEQGIQSGGIYIAEAVGCYLVARCLIRTAAHFRTMVRCMTGLVLALLVFTAFESVTGHHLIRDLSRSILGGPGLPVIEKRLGLSRAFGSFEHPILYGVFCASAMALSTYVLSTDRGLPGWRTLRSGLLALATFFSLSSGALAALAAQLFLMAWDRFTRAIPSRWLLLGGAVGFLCVVISLVSSRSPIKVFLTYMTFSPGTGYNRLTIWDYGSAEAMRHPILGIGLKEWTRPIWMHSTSMDNFWLCTAVRYGIPAFTALAGAFTLIAWHLGTLGKQSLDRDLARRAWLISLSGLALAGCTVHFWNALFSLFCFLLGSGVWLMEPQKRGATALPSRNSF